MFREFFTKLTIQFPSGIFFEGSSGKCKMYQLCVYILYQVCKEDIQHLQPDMKSSKLVLYAEL